MFLETWSGSFAGLLSLVKVEGGRHGEVEGVRRVMCARDRERDEET